MQRNQSPSCAKCNKGSQFAAHSASNVSKLSVKSMPMPRPSRNCKANKRSHRDVEAQQSSDQVAYWSYCHLLRFSSHWDPTHRYGLSCNDTVTKSSSRKRGLEGVEASSQLFQSGEDQATSSGMSWSLGADLKCDPFHWPSHEADAVNLATYDEPEASIEMCFVIIQWLWERCGVVGNVPFVQRALIMAQDHVISSQAKRQPTPSLEDLEVDLCTHEQVVHVAHAMVTPTVVNMAPSKKRKGAPKTTSGVKKSKAVNKKPRPVEALRTTFRKLIAWLEEVPAMLKEQDVIITKMTKEILLDILQRLLMGLEPPLSLSDVPETKIIEVALRRTFPDRMWSAQESTSDAIFKVGCGSYKQQQWLKENELWPPCGRQLSIQHISKLKG